MNDIIEAISSRVKSPYFGYSVIAFFALNWRGIFLLTFSSAPPHIRISEFETQASYWTLVVLPLLVGAIVAAITPWVRLAFSFIGRKPFELIDRIHLESEHVKIVRKMELEKARDRMFALREEVLIERAQRDEKVAEIEDPETKQRLIKEIEALRQERDKVSFEVKNLSIQGNSLSMPARLLLKTAASDTSGRILKLRVVGGKKFQVAEKVFGEDGERDFARFDAALDELISLGLVKPVGSKDQVFELTHNGWELAHII